MHVKHRMAGLNNVRNQLRAVAHEKVAVAIVRHQCNAVAPLAKSRGRVVALHFVHHRPGLVDIGELALGLAHRQPAHAHIEQLGTGRILIPLALIVIEQGIVVVRRIAGRRSKRRQRLARLVGGHVVLVGFVEIGIALERHPGAPPGRLEVLVIMRVRFVIERRVAEQQQLQALALRGPLVHLLHQVANGRHVLAARGILVVDFGGRHHGHAQVVVLGAVVGQALGLPPKHGRGHNQQVEALVEVESVQVLAGHFPEGARRGEHAAGLQSHEFAQRIGRGCKGSGIKRLGSSLARVGHVPHLGIGRGARQHVAVAGPKPDVGQGSEFQLRTAQAQLALGIQVEIVEIASGGGVGAAVRQAHFQVAAGVRQRDLQGRRARGGHGAVVAVGPLAERDAAQRRAVDRELKKAGRIRAGQHRGKNAHRRASHQIRDCRKRNVLLPPGPEALAHPFAARVQQIQQVVLVKFTVGKRVDGGGPGRGQGGGSGHPQARFPVGPHKVVGGIGVKVVAVPEHAIPRFPGMRPGRVEQEVFVVVEHVVVVAVDKQNVILGQVVGALRGIGLGQNPHRVAVEVQVVGVEAGHVQPHLAQGSLVKLVHPAFGHADFEPVAAGQHRSRAVHVGRAGGSARRHGLVAVVEGDEALGLAGLGVAAGRAQTQVGYRQLHFGAGVQARLGAGRQAGGIEQLNISRREGLVH